MSVSGLNYIGNGAFIPGIPARDLAPEEVEQYGGERKLLRTGLYQKVRSNKKESKEESDARS